MESPIDESGGNVVAEVTSRFAQRRETTRCLSQSLSLAVPSSLVVCQDLFLG
ncbi:hypothetical protein RISK_002227 [Rhodopirellula islandica]|uniref:Uncharacterized protein n=1 Tax=Rhodopirellula islandica TaxID=595434 RepID=A0A0J1BGC6_RHOIS|nr:hypothetical protein RISK_002227 [Rhodopirellula islandica]